MQKAFNKLKQHFTKALILVTYNLEKDIVLKTNTLNKAIKGYLS
jgi:hypothetical protein